MKKNTVLNIAIIICKSLRLLYVLIFFAITVIFIHYQISPSSYKDLNFKTSHLLKNNNFNVIKSYKVNVEGKTPLDSEVFRIDKLKFTSLLFNYIQLSLLFALYFLCTKEFQNVIESVRKIKTFQKKNSNSFKKIGKYLLLIFFLTGYTSYKFELGGASGFNISFTLLIFTLLNFIMSEVFKEGNKLSEESELTI
jgi:hypothetical protein